MYESPYDPDRSWYSSIFPMEKFRGPKGWVFPSSHGAVSGGPTSSQRDAEVMVFTAPQTSGNEKKPWKPMDGKMETRLICCWENHVEHFLT